MHLWIYDHLIAAKNAILAIGYGQNRPIIQKLGLICVEEFYYRDMNEVRRNHCDWIYRMKQPCETIIRPKTTVKIVDCR